MWISTVPPLWHVMGKTRTPGRALAWGSGSSTIRRGFWSSIAFSASLTTVGRVQLPPTQPWKVPSRITSATSPTCAEMGGLRATTVASTNGSPRRARSEASSSKSRCIGLSPRHMRARMLVVLGDIDVAQGVLRPDDDRSFAAVLADDALGAMLALHGEQLGKEGAVVENRGRI